MSITPLPVLDRFSPTFRAQVDTFFETQLSVFTHEINAEIERINEIGAGSFTATSSTSLTIGTGTINLTIDTGKGFAPGQAVIVARTATPADFMAGQVVSYDAGTGAMVVNATTSGGSGTHSGWMVSITAIVSALELDSIIVLTSGTSWTCPAGVRKVVGYVEGGGGGAGTNYNGGGGGGGGVMFVSNVTPGAVYSYAIGAGGAAGPTGAAGGSSSIQINGTTFSAPGGSGGSFYGPGGSKGSNGVGVFGSSGSQGTNSNGPAGGNGAFGIGRGGSGGQPGLSGGIILELYK